QCVNKDLYVLPLLNTTNTHSVTSCPLNIHVCQHPPVRIYLSASTCVSIHLSASTCVSIHLCQHPPVRIYLSASTCVSIHLCQHPLFSIHLSASTCQHPPVSHRGHTYHSCKNGSLLITRIQRELVCGVLGPLLFLIYIHDFETVCKNVLPLMFAADTYLTLMTL
uniref:Uncharacterized protein n=1 Tax=Astatotilapia calliptera TaxID=8154 RepID=A0A3P8P787_ASTCA